MKHLFLPTILAVASTSLFAQNRLDVPLLFPTHQIAPATYTGTECDLNRFVSAAEYASCSPLQQQMLVRAANFVPTDAQAPHHCWHVPQPNSLMALWNSIMQPAQFNPITRWSNTATQGGGLGQGDRTVLTYSFVPDGTTVPASQASAQAPSSLFATFNGGFPNQQTWQDRVGDALNRWGELAGITYVFEPNDDGVPLSSASGVLGVRGDLRIASVPIDGGSNILAFNSFPNNGDMVLDADDINFFANSSGNYLRFFNVIAHEHGHGLGIAHVCPIEGTKLMEPFINLGFSGPQFDDILTSQRQYGDPLEPNDSLGQATNLGTLGNGTDFTTLVSIDGSGDQDWFRFTTTAPHLAEVTVRPSGAPYLEGDQNSNGSCQPGVSFDPRALRNLAFEIRDSNGVTVLSSVDSGPAGATETSPTTLLPAAGTYYVRVFGGGTDNVQIYELEVELNQGPTFSLEVVGGVPDSVPSDAPSAITVRVVPDLGTADPNTGLLYTRTAGGTFQVTPLQNVGGDDYRGLLPATACFEIIDFYVSFAPQGGGTTVFAPAGAPSAVYSIDVLNLPLTSLFADDFEANQGWTVQNDAALTDGAWDRGVPAGLGDRGDPATDADGSGQCYLTDNVDGNTDVDGGATTLFSPLFNLAGQPDALISYSYWYTNNFGSAPGQDFWVVEISADAGATWTVVQNTSASTADWTDVEFRVSDYVPLTNLVRMRFTASDPAPGAVVEAGLDAFRVAICPPSPTELLAGACGGPFASSTIATDLAPVAGTSINIECEAIAQVSGPAFVGFVLGLSPVGAPLPSCGCIVHPTLDFLDLQVANWTAPLVENWTLPFAIPAGTTGLQFYVQGLVAGLGSNTCTEAGLPINLTDALRVTVQ